MMVSGNTLRHSTLRHSSFRNLKNSAKCLVLYGDGASPPVRFVKMTASILGVGLEYRKIDLFQNENSTEFYKKINPLRKVPVLQAGEDVICDSHAIAIFLCHNHRDQSLYPEDPLTRAKVNQMLFFNASVLFPIDSAIFTNFFAGRWNKSDEKNKEWIAALDHMEFNLNGRKWLTGDQMHLCDICAVCTITSMHELVPLTPRHSNVIQWVKRFEVLSCYEINKIGLLRLKKFINLKKDN